MEASQLPGGEGGMGASQLWSWVLLLSTFFFWGAGGESASGVGVVVFCGEWRRVSFRVLSSAGNGGKSASGGAKGEWRRVSFGVVCVVVFFFSGASHASRGCVGDRGRVSFGVVCVVVFFFSGASQLPGGA